MNDRKEFVLAVIVALVIPLLIGGVYFYKMSIIKGSNNILARLIDKKEMILFGDKSIELGDSTALKDDDYENADFLEFEVLYASGPEANDSYKLQLKNILNPEGINLNYVSWVLVRVDGSVQTFVSRGNLVSNGKLDLNPLVNINLGETHHYRLYYYFNREIKDNSVSLTAKLAIE